MVKKLLVSGIKAYQRLSHALLFRNCRFYPSCSQYAIEAIERFGIARGMQKQPGASCAVPQRPTVGMTQ